MLLKVTCGSEKEGLSRIRHTELVSQGFPDMAWYSLCSPNRPKTGSNLLTSVSQYYDYKLEP